MVVSGKVKGKYLIKQLNLYIILLIDSKPLYQYEDR
uniref:Uncharacterized protein n=1 Tax=Ascaris lumbricoides TaxID=6252 RepID=A0A0M3HL07_ASCLU